MYTPSPAVNECEDNNGGCEGTCVNTPMSFECHCGDGYSLAADGRNCEGNSCTQSGVSLGLLYPTILM